MSAAPAPCESWCDELGPTKIVHLWEPRVKMRGILVIDNLACGPSIGGVRMAPDVDTREVFRLARAMTLKNAAAGLPHGGGKAGILADPATTDREALVRAFARGIRELTDYVPGPDMGTDEAAMAWTLDEIGRAVGLPRVLGGIPLDELGATGFGLAECACVAADAAGLDLEGADVAIEGFGNVGRHAAASLAERGCRLVAASDSKGAVHDPSGMDVEALSEAKRKTGSVTGFDAARKIEQADLLTVPCDILVPAARPDSIHEENADAIQAKLILQGANIPATPAAEARLHERGVLSIPDFIANAGGVICASVELHGGTEGLAFATIAEKIRHNTGEVLKRSHSAGVLPRAGRRRPGARTRARGEWLPQGLARRPDSSATRGVVASEKRRSEGISASVRGGPALVCPSDVHSLAPPPRGIQFRRGPRRRAARLPALGELCTLPRREPPSRRVAHVRRRRCITPRSLGVGP